MDLPNTQPEGTIGGNSMDGGTVDLSAVKRGRGRPPGSKSKTAPNSNAPKSAPAGVPVSDADAAFLSESCVLLLETGDEVIAKSLANRLAAACPERGDDFMRLHSQVGLNEKDKGMLRVSVAALVRKYAVLGRFGPEILLFVFVVQYGLRQVKLAKFVEQTIAEKKAKKTE